MIQSNDLTRIPGYEPCDHDQLLDAMKEFVVGEESGRYKQARPGAVPPLSMTHVFWINGRGSPFADRILTNMLQPIRELCWESMSEPMQSQPNPAWNVVETRVRSLAEAISGEVFPRAANGSTLSVGGDRGKGYIVGLSHNDSHRNLLAPPSRREGTVNLVIGFQPADFPRRIVVELSVALKVALTFFKTGRADDTEEWTADGAHSGHR